MEERTRRAPRAQEGESLFADRGPVVVAEPAVGEPRAPTGVRSVVHDARHLFGQIAGTVRAVASETSLAPSAVVWSLAQVLAAFASVPIGVWHAAVTGPGLLRDQVRARPGRALALGAGVGFALGLALRRTLLARPALRR